MADLDILTFQVTNKIWIFLSMTTLLKSKYTFK